MANATLRYRIFEYLRGQFLCRIWEISDSDSEALLQAVRQSQIPKRPIFVI
ncbi:hypothetical protein [Dolichospermum sp. LEGE 00246]|uniref:hypothetical protein n=1 Tax=Dolichospermum sp. LEGE 00246 TaxID=1828605 RepID=UPI0004ADD711|nr:hypothetical protein [Dolichospermum sp. LEGE 00246]MDK2412304.1 hypothetical protein [Aphanizomenon sp. 202]MDK2459560.1 hypothetical protein [Aphanizomenon sp. PH219]